MRCQSGGISDRVAAERMRWKEREEIGRDGRMARMVEGICQGGIVDGKEKIERLRDGEGVLIWWSPWDVPHGINYTEVNKWRRLFQTTHTPGSTFQHPPIPGPTAPHSSTTTCTPLYTSPHSSTIALHFTPLYIPLHTTPHSITITHSTSRHSTFHHHTTPPHATPHSITIPLHLTPLHIPSPSHSTSHHSTFHHHTTPPHATPHSITIPLHLTPLHIPSPYHSTSHHSTFHHHHTPPHTFPHSILTLHYIPFHIPFSHSTSHLTTFHFHIADTTLQGHTVHHHYNIPKL
ncbi:hypothetical protein Pcinc_033731 [Petrolisthes cinctipes]|uniref:Uncharacterized protein n=1 Tax=Petrolisthes cinctipes TaxID=88211 RepID=A0AAE1ERK8_PETCI|nr:hypothetical protein Pcinc_033731 [Petrolisthes cinctipes]